MYSQFFTTSIKFLTRRLSDLVIAISSGQAVVVQSVVCFVEEASRLEYVIKHYFSCFSTKTYVVGTQKNHLNEMVLLSTQNLCLN